MAAPAAETFPRKLCWQLLGLWVVFIGGSAFGMLMRAFTGDTSFQFVIWLLILVALPVQLWGVAVAIGLLRRERRYRTPKNIAMTVAGLVPIASFVLAAMTSGLRLHM